MSTIYTNIRRKTQEFSSALGLCSNLDEMPQTEPWKSIRLLYQAPEGELQYLGTVLNAIFTEQKPAFVLSRYYVVGLLRNDPNRDPSESIEDHLIDKMMAFVTQRGIFNTLRHPTLEKGSPRSGLYQLIEPEMALVLQQKLGGEKATQDIINRRISIYDRTLGNGGRK